VFLTATVTRPSSVIATQSFVIRNYSSTWSVNIYCGTADDPKPACDGAYDFPSPGYPESTTQHTETNLAFPVKLYEVNAAGGTHDGDPVPRAVQRERGCVPVRGAPTRAGRRTGSSLHRHDDGRSGEQPVAERCRAEYGPTLLRYQRGGSEIYRQRAILQLGVHSAERDRGSVHQVHQANPVSRADEGEPGLHGQDHDDICNCGDDTARPCQSRTESQPRPR